MCVYEVLTNLSLEGCVTKTVVAKTEMLWSILRVSPRPALRSEQGGSRDRSGQRGGAVLKNQWRALSA